MPIHKVGSGWQWGRHGKIYPTRKQAERQAAAAYAHGYREVAKSIDDFIIRKSKKQALTGALVGAGLAAAAHAPLLPLTALGALEGGLKQNPQSLKQSESPQYVHRPTRKVKKKKLEKTFPLGAVWGAMQGMKKYDSVQSAPSKILMSKEIEAFLAKQEGY